MRTIIFAISLLLTVFCHSQPYSIGDKVPIFNLPAEPGMNQPPSTVAYKGKLLILDFWSVNCFSCIASFPMVDAIQQKYGDKLQIIAITKDKKEVVEKMFTRRPYLRPRVPFLIGDTLFSTAFPHKFVPHHVWINEKGIVKYITHGANLNETTLDAYFRGEHLNFLKSAFLKDYDHTQPIWKEGGGRIAHHVKYYSMLSDYITEHGNFISWIDEDKVGITGFTVVTQVC
ncbi:MAG: TlpA disulfide reductase family protein [Chitinophagaceae bacterium]